MQYPVGGAQVLRMRVACTFEFTSAVAAPAIFLVRPAAAGPHRILHEQWSTEPFAGYHDYVDLFGNVPRRLTLPAGRGSIAYEAVLESPTTPDAADYFAPEVPVGDLPDDVLVYLLPSRYCLSDQLVSQAWNLFGNTAPGWNRVAAITAHAHHSLRFSYGTSIASTSVLDVLSSGMGVCRDYAHLAVSLCRAMSIPARYVFGYLPDIGVPLMDAPMDFAAWFEAYLGDRWWTFDARNNMGRIGRAVIARGRDAADVAMVTSFGPVQLTTMGVTAEAV